MQIQDKDFYPFDNTTPPKKIVAFAMAEIAETMKPDGFKLLKGNNEIIKRSEKFVYRLQPQSNRWNAKGVCAEMWIHCDVCDRETEVGFWWKTLATSNDKRDQLKVWELYDAHNYKNSLRQINEILTMRLLPFFRRFEHDLQTFVEDVTENGFRAFSDTQVYDANYYIPVEFLLKYGTKTQLNIAFQRYIDRHQLVYVKPNMQKAIALLKEGKEVAKNGEKTYAEFAVKHALKLVF